MWEGKEGGGYGALLIVVVLVVLFASWRGNGGVACADGGYGGGYGGGRPADFIEMAKLSRYEDPALCCLKTEVERNTRILEHDVDIQACKTRELIQAESCRTDSLIEKEARCAAERDYQAQICALKEKLECERFEISDLKTSLKFDKLAAQQEQYKDLVLRKIDCVEDQMLKAPKQFGVARQELTVPCGFDRDLERVIARNDFDGRREHRRCRDCD